MPSNSNSFAPERESFDKFYESWIIEQERLLEELLAAAARYGTPGEKNGPDGTGTIGYHERHEAQLRRLVELVLGHYEHYYRAKSASAKLDVGPIFTPKWTSSTENLFLWIGGWRPSMAFHLLYSKSGLQLQNHIDDYISGIQFGNLGDISLAQLAQVDELHRATVQREREITEEAARTQETVVDPEVVELSRVMTEISGDRRESHFEEMEVEMGRKMEGMETALEKADGLRLETLKAVIGILRPIQAVHFLIAAAEVHLRVHEWGKRKDESEAAASGPENLGSTSHSDSAR